MNNFYQNQNQSIPENQTREEQDKAFLTLAHELRTNRRIIKGMTAGLDTNL